MKIKRITLTLLMITIVFTAFAGCSNKTATAPENDKPAEEAKPITIKFAHNGVSDMTHPQNVAMLAFKEMVEKNSNGQITVETYPAAQLGDARTIVEGVQMGTIEMADIENGPMGRFVPEAMLWDLPYLFRDLDQAHAVLDGPIGDKVRSLFIDKGIRVLAFNDGGFRYFTNNARPINSMEDMKGLKIRVMESEVMISSINGFGATAIPMAFGELYTALQQGTVDGQENPLDLIQAQGFYEVQDYLSLSEHFYYPRQYIISEKLYQSLTPELQKIIEDASIEACRINREELAKYTKTLIDKLKSEGMEVNEVDKSGFIKAAQEEIYPKFYETIGGGDAAAGKALIEEVVNIK